MFWIFFVLLVFSTGDCILIGKIDNNILVGNMSESLWNITQSQCICEMINSNGTISTLNYFSANQTCQLFYTSFTSILIEFNANSSLIFMNQSAIFIAQKPTTTSTTLSSISSLSAASSPTTPSSSSSSTTTSSTSSTTSSTTTTETTTETTSSSTTTSSTTTSSATSTTTTSSTSSSTTTTETTTDTTTETTSSSTTTSSTTTSSATSTTTTSSTSSTTTTTETATTSSTSSTSSTTTTETATTSSTSSTITTTETITSSTTETTSTTESSPSTTTGALVCGNGSTLLTFDDLLSNTAIPNGYNGINWNNAYAILFNAAGVSGYPTGTVSGNLTSFNANGTPMTMTGANGTLFTLKSAAIAAAWKDNLQLTVVGYRSNVVIANNTFILQVFTVSYITFNGYSGLDTAIFSTSGGTRNPNVISNNTQYAMDNLCLSFP
ncbi:unnamed protein product [Adineta steineri]|uniref:Uncharacterized protein n=1 Tax=Adineta steineri TaxID=433720 RepID=A0A815AY81_9BILA|nr:unnamed protein product [Adineta steineri]CAF3490667.1 unnamed protein product [Adineta steineri]